VIEYFQRVLILNPTAGIHSATAAPMTVYFLTPATKDIGSSPVLDRPRAKNIYGSVAGGVPSLRERAGYDRRIRQSCARSGDYPAFLFSGSGLGLPGAFRAVSHPHKLASA
jgi:hypothetical protein